MESIFQLSTFNCPLPSTPRGYLRLRFDSKRKGRPRGLATSVQKPVSSKCCHTRLKQMTISMLILVAKPNPVKKRSVPDLLTERYLRRYQPADY